MTGGSLLCYVYSFCIVCLASAHHTVDTCFLVCWYRQCLNIVSISSIYMNTIVELYIIYTSSQLCLAASLASLVKYLVAICLSL
uniref:Putative secreted protein n=1 Tax=Rhipicephalus microplus TaxID=6941 RepID=A0A6M2DD84_RHIMP